jgi:hypothetical protein
MQFLTPSTPLTVSMLGSRGGGPDLGLPSIGCKAFRRKEGSVWQCGSVRQCGSVWQ